MERCEAPAGAKLVGGIWLPEGEVHLAEMLTRHSKIGPVDGKATYQLHKLRAALALQPRDRRRTCLDIGAHVGLWSMHLVKEFLHVHAFEPVPAHADLFVHNVGAGAALHRCAVGDGARTVSIEVPDETSGNGHVLAPGAAPRVPSVPHPSRREVWHGVPMVTIDGLAFETVDFIKIDVEGYELPVVEGARETILRCRPNIVVEQKGNETAYGDAKDAAVNYLIDLGMSPLCKPLSGDWIMGW